MGLTTAPPVRTAQLTRRFLLPAVAAALGALVAAIPWLVATLDHDQIQALEIRLAGEARHAGTVIPWGERGPRLDEIILHEVQNLGVDEIARCDAARVAYGERLIVDGSHDRPPQVHESDVPVRQVRAPRSREDLELALRARALRVVVVDLIGRRANARLAARRARDAAYVVVERDDGACVEQTLKPLLHLRVVRCTHGFVVEEVGEFRTAAVQLEALLVQAQAPCVGPRVANRHDVLGERRLYRGKTARWRIDAHLRCDVALRKVVQRCFDRVWRCLRHRALRRNSKDFPSVAGCAGELDFSRLESMRAAAW